jgi:hypothetical protein
MEFRIIFMLIIALVVFIAGCVLLGLGSTYANSIDQKEKDKAPTYNLLGAVFIILSVGTIFIEWLYLYFFNI